MIFHKYPFIVLIIVGLLISCKKENLKDLNESQPEANEISITQSSSIPYTYFYAIDFDRDNNLWMNTIIIDTSIYVPPASSYLPMKSLLICFDGEIYTIYDGLAFKEMFFDVNDNLWLYNGSQLMTFNKYENKFEVHYTVQDEESYIEKVYLDSKNKIWIEGSKNIGLLMQTKDGWKKQFTPSEYYKMHIDKNGDTYFSTLKNNVLKYSDGNEKVVGEETWKDNFLLDRRGLLTDDNNRLWVSVASSDSSKMSLAVFEEEKWEAKNPPIGNEEEIHSLETMFLDKKGRLWVQNNIIVDIKIVGNALFVLQNETWFQYEDIINDHIYDYAFDRNDNLWLTTYKKGIIKVDF